MRVFVVTLGTRGDLELFLTLGRALSRRGHAVTLGAAPFYGERVRKTEVGFVPLGDGSRAEMVGVLSSLADVPDLTERSRQFFLRWLRTQLSAAMPRIAELAGASDYFVSNLKLVLRRGNGIIPCASVTYDPPLDQRDLERYGPPRPEVLDLVAMNRRLLDPDRIWGARYRFTGFWMPIAESAWQPSERLLAFLRDGRPPLAVTLGSMATFDAARFARLLVESLQMAAQRAVVVGAWSDLSGVDVDDDHVHFVDEAPYAWLFPLSSLVLHHGSVGAAAAALHAGRPSIVLPQIACQRVLGRLLEREQLAAAALDLAAVSAAELAAAIQRGLCDHGIAESTRCWQAEVAADGGVERAAELIESHFAGLHHGG